MFLDSFPMKCGISLGVLSLGFAHPLCWGFRDHPRCLSCRNMWLHGPRLVVHLNPSSPRCGTTTTTIDLPFQGTIWVNCNETTMSPIARPSGWLKAWKNNSTRLVKEAYQLHRTNMNQPTNHHCKRDDKIPIEFPWKLIMAPKARPGNARKALKHLGHLGDHHTQLSSPPIHGNGRGEKDMINQQVPGDHLMNVNPESINNKKSSTDWVGYTIYTQNDE